LVGLLDAVGDGLPGGHDARVAVLGVEQVLEPLVAVLGGFVEVVDLLVLVRQEQLRLVGALERPVGDRLFLVRQCIIVVERLTHALDVAQRGRPRRQIHADA
jgi:hypothetical protein